jgi:hypothetical protein
MSAAEYFVPTAAARVKAVVSLVAILLWGFTHHLWFAPLIEQIDTCALCSTLWATRVTAVYLALLPMPACLWFAHSASQILKSGQNPPPQSWLLFKVRLYRGVRARISAYLLTFAAFVTALAPGFLAHHLGFAYLLCIAAECGCYKEANLPGLACDLSAKRNEA